MPRVLAPRRARAIAGVALLAFAGWAPAGWAPRAAPRCQLRGKPRLAARAARAGAGARGGATTPPSPARAGGGGGARARGGGCPPPAGPPPPEGSGTPPGAEAAPAGLIADRVFRYTFRRGDGFLG